MDGASVGQFNGRHNADTQADGDQAQQRAEPVARTPAAPQKANNEAVKKEPEKPLSKPGWWRAIVLHATTDQELGLVGGTLLPVFRAFSQLVWSESEPRPLGSGPSSPQNKRRV